MEQKQWRIGAIDVKDRTRKARELDHIRGLTDEQQFQGGDANFQAVRSRLADGIFFAEREEKSTRREICRGALDSIDNPALDRARETISKPQS